jgi:hypothetical protein
MKRTKTKEQPDLQGQLFAFAHDFTESAVGASSWEREHDAIVKINFLFPKTISKKICVAQDFAELPEGASSWEREHLQRDAIVRGLHGAGDEGTHSQKSSIW